MARVLDLNLWRKFLRHSGLIHIRTKGGHEYWDYPDDSLERPVVFSAHYKQITSFQIGTNLHTLEKTMQDLDDWLRRGGERKKK